VQLRVGRCGAGGDLPSKPRPPGLLTLVASASHSLVAQGTPFLPRIGRDSGIETRLSAEGRGKTAAAGKALTEPPECRAKCAESGDWRRDGVEVQAVGAESVAPRERPE
jgi:hypothetical protein